VALPRATEREAGLGTLVARMIWRYRRSPTRLFPLFLLILFAPACKPSRPQPAREANPAKLAAQFRHAMERGGGAQVWVKRAAPAARSQSASASLEVAATPPGYSSALAAVIEEAQRDKLDSKLTGGQARGGLRSAVLTISQGSQTLLEIHLQEVPRLRRAAIVIDDLGGDLTAARRFLGLGAPLAFSILPHLRYSRATAQDAHLAGCEVMLHLPMEPQPGARVGPGEGAILVGMSSSALRKTIQLDLESVPYVAGVNNHMGSRATEDAALMANVMKLLAERRLYFIDSRTTARSTALAAARSEHLPAFYRAVFLDDTTTVAYTLRQLEELRRVAEQEGVALAIGHPHLTTRTALAEFIPTLDHAGIELVPPSAIVRLPEAARLEPPAPPGSP